MPYIETYYRTKLGDVAPDGPPLREALAADACVVGAGLAGLTVALELARGGRRVCVLDAQKVGWGASGRNGGMVSPGWSARHKTVELYAGRAQAEALHRLSIEGVDIVARNLDALHVAKAQVVYGHLSAARYAAGDELRRQRDWLARTFDYETAFWERDAVRAVLNSPRYHQGLFSPRAFHFDPLAYALALADEIRRLGGMIFENSPVTALESVGGARRALTAGGSVTARDLVLCSGGYTGGFAPKLRASVLPVATYVMLTQADPDLIATAIRTDAAIGDRRRAGDYYRLVDGGTRILWGGKITTRTAPPRALAQVLHGSMSATFPQLKPLRVEMAWSGLMGYARHLMPQIGPMEDGLWTCAAFGGHGVNTTAIGGQIVAEAILGHSDRYRLFAPFGLTWNGGVFGRAAAQATYWALQAQDAIREARSR